MSSPLTSHTVTPAARPAPAARRLAGAVGLVLAAVVGATALVATPADAALPAVVQRPTTSVTADALPTVQTKGVVWSTAVKGNTVYAGGKFTAARPAGAAVGSQESPRGNLLSFDVTTGALLSGFAPQLNGQVLATAVSPDQSRLYVAGSFTDVAPTPGAAVVKRYRLAAFDTATGALVSTFAPADVGGTVNAIVVTDTAVYVGGSFSGLGRKNVAAFRASDGALTGWAPLVDRVVYSMARNAAGTKIILGGSFTTVTVAKTATKVVGLTSLDASTGAVQPFTVNQTVVNGIGTGAGIWSLNTVGNVVYGTAFSKAKDGNFEGAFAANADTGAITWLADCHGDSYDTAVANGVVYVASHWHLCKNIGGFQDSSPIADSGRTFQRANGVTVAAKGTVANNTEGDPGSFEGKPAPAMVNWFPDLTIPVSTDPTFTGRYQAAWTASATSRFLVLGGEFTKVNGTTQMGLVRFSVDAEAGGVAPAKRGPESTPKLGKSDTGTPVVRSIGSTGSYRARISWATSYDQDDVVLSYAVYRSGSTTPVCTVSKGSFFWNRPWLNCDDTAVNDGQTYSYTVKATDPDGNSDTSAATAVTIGTEALPASTPYSTAVLADSPSSYWRMDDRPGPNVALDSSTTGKQPLLVRKNGVSFGRPGATGDGDTAAEFSGDSNGAAATGSLLTAPNTFTVETWFKTADGNQGGRLIGFGDFQPTDKFGGGVVESGLYDRQVYLGDDAHLYFGVKPTVARAIRSPQAYADGQWHQVVATLAGSGPNQGMKLYVDGKPVVSSTPNTTYGAKYTGFWRVGGDTLSRWWHEPASDYFKGTIDDVAVWNSTALTPAQVQAHFDAATR